MLQERIVSRLPCCIIIKEGLCSQETLKKSIVLKQVLSQRISNCSIDPTSSELWLWDSFPFRPMLVRVSEEIEGTPVTTRSSGIAAKKTDLILLIKGD